MPPRTTACGGLPFPGLRADLWKRYLGVIADGIRPGGATKLHPGPPPRRLFERPEYGIVFYLLAIERVRA